MSDAASRGPSRRIVAAALIAAAGFAAAPVFADVFTDPIRPEATALDFTPWMTGAKAEFRGAFALSPPTDAFGGLSGLVMEGPRRALAISDRAMWHRLDLSIENGRLIGVDAIADAPLIDAPDGEGEEDRWDPEGLTRGAGGEIWISFEREHRLQPVAGPDVAPGPILQRDDWTRFSENGGLEALATAPDGALWAIRERPDGDDRHPVYAIGRAGWRLAAWPEDGPFRPTGADFGADGSLYLAERAFTFTGGFRFRLRRIRWGDGEIPESRETLAVLPSESLIDNIEGVAVWEEGGETLILVVSDDNFSPFQRNVVALFAVR